MCQLKSLKLAYNHIGDAGAIRLAQALRHSNCKLEKLEYAHPTSFARTLTPPSLSGCSIETSGAQAIVDSVKCSLTIKTVYLFGNQHDLEEELKQALAGPRKPSTTSRRISGLVFRAS